MVGGCFRIAKNLGCVVHYVVGNALFWNLEARPQLN